MRFTNIGWTLGAHDIVATIDAPDDETLAAALLTVAAQGNIRTTTLRAFNRRASAQHHQQDGLIVATSPAAARRVQDANYAPPPARVRPIRPTGLSGLVLPPDRGSIWLSRARFGSTPTRRQM